MLRVVSVNIEGRKHLEPVTEFLRAEKPDVLCLQEVYEVDLSVFQEIIGGEVFFAPMLIRDGGKAEGVALISKFPFTAEEIQFAGVEGSKLPIYDDSTFESAVRSQKYKLIHATISAPDGAYTICTTHLPVTQKGEVDAYQMEAIGNLITKLESIGEFVVMGDMNAPRGRRSFSELAKRFRDNIPFYYESSLDPELHRAGHLKRMVDGCFSTSTYSVKQTRFQCGISDHCALCMEVTKVATQQQAQ